MKFSDEIQKFDQIKISYVNFILIWILNNSLVDK